MNKHAIAEMKTTKNSTVYDAQTKRNLERATLALYPEVGILCREGKTIFYATIAGQHYESSNLDTVTLKVSPTPRIVRPAS